MLVYRICQPKYAHDLSGEGARLFGGRWNSKGMACLYTADSSALALLEFAIHHSKHVFPEKLALLQIEVAESLEVREVPHEPTALKELTVPYCRSIGDPWLTGMDVPVLKVPSILVPFSFNLLFNPATFNKKDIQILSLSIFEPDERMI